MDKSFDQQSSETRSKTDPLGSLLQMFFLIMGRLTAWFVLTEEEKIGAGIYIGRMGEDE